MSSTDIVRWCEDIGMFATDRPINDVVVGTTLLAEGSCVHASSFCKPTCFNLKLYRIYPNMLKRDVRVEETWRNIKGSVFASTLLRKRKQTSRVRFKTRGEAIKDASDIDRVRDIVNSCADTLFWMPTRAWRDADLADQIVTLADESDNLIPLASTDPSTTDDEWAWLKANGWSTMYYGSDMSVTPNGDRTFTCPKTHKGLKGHCAICKGGCFAPKALNRRVDVNLGVAH